MVITNIHSINDDNSLNIIDNIRNSVSTSSMSVNTSNSINNIDSSIMILIKV
jgi:hypothetical protein